MSDFHEDEALGRSYDGRLMARFLKYVRPYVPLVVPTLIFLLGKTLTELASPLILKMALDGPLARGDASGLTR